MISGIEIEGGVDQISFEIKALQTNFEVPLLGLNPIEIAAVQGYNKLLHYFFDEINLKSSKHLKVADLVDEMYFIVAPLFKRDTETFKLLMD